MRNTSIVPGFRFAIHRLYYLVPTYHWSTCTVSNLSQLRGRDMTLKFVLSSQLRLTELKSNFVYFVNITSQDAGCLVQLISIDESTFWFVSRPLKFSSRALEALCLMFHYRTVQHSKIIHGDLIAMVLTYRKMFSNHSSSPRC
ncbi:hypothetical protein RRG08_046132 [Elysia crispata]|uniref:Uncharacterized protein n=1 Tax=Elysia crispata TaxID=231223 RepID=A0AAE1A2U4_9GAST|nr:hypothetical protein RRG08_046132 [Elysia crispata]